MKSKLILPIYLISHIITFNILPTDLESKEKAETLEISKEDQVNFCELAERLSLIALRQKLDLDDSVKKILLVRTNIITYGMQQYLRDFFPYNRFQVSDIEAICKVLNINFEICKRFFLVLDSYCKKANDIPFPDNHQVKTDEMQARATKIQAMQIELQRKIRYADIVYSIYEYFTLLDLNPDSLETILDKNPELLSKMNFVSLEKSTLSLQEKIDFICKNSLKETTLTSHNCIVC